MVFFATDNYPNGYQPEVSMPEAKPPKCTSAEKDLLEKIYSNIMNKTFECEELRKENKELREKLKKARKEKKRWKKKYFKLYNDAIILKNTVDAFNVLHNPNSSSIERIEAGFGIPPIKPLNEDELKPTNSIKSKVKPGSMDWLYEV